MRDGNNEPPSTPPPFTFFLMMLSHIPPPSLLRLGLRALMYMASFTHLSNHLGSVVNTSSVFQLHRMLGVKNVDVFWNLWGFRARSPMFAKAHLQGSFSLTNIHHIALFSFDLAHWPTTFSFFTGSFGFTNNCRSVFVGLKYVGMP